MNYAVAFCIFGNAGNYERFASHTQAEDKFKEMLREHDIVVLYELSSNGKKKVLAQFSTRQLGFMCDKLELL